MNVLIVGSGGREHALAWKIAQSPQVKKIYCAPGNGGTAGIAENIPIRDADIPALAEFAAKESIGLTVVGPEVPLALGIVDEFEKRSLRIFGPSRKAAELEASKVFAKQFMARHRIPTGRFRVTDSLDEAGKIFKSGEFTYPLVVKADGLAAGKGAVVCPTLKKAEETASEMLVEGRLGEAGKRIVIEEFLRGREVSFIVISDGRRVQPLVSAMDHKTAYDGDKGPNTGGMGAISPSPFLDERAYGEIMDLIIYPTVTRMLEEGRKIKGVLYAGLMVTAEGPKVLEFNCRFGDPETQPQMLRLKSDLIEIIQASVDEDLLRLQIEWSDNPSGCVVLASGGYPVKYEKGKLIMGLDDVAAMPDIAVFHAGTRFESGNCYTSGGRVLGVCASDTTLTGTMTKIYAAIEHIHFEAMHFRRDIGAFREVKS